MVRMHDKLMSCLKKRDLLNDAEANAAILISEGEKFWKAGYIQDALEFFSKAGFETGIDQVISWAVEEGDFFVADSASKASGRDLGPSDWAALGEKAMKKGKYHFAFKAFTRAGDGEKSEAARKYIEDGLRSG
jgi:hypothetical protein